MHHHKKGRTIVLASRYNLNHHPPPDAPPGTKFAAAQMTFGGFGVTAAPVIQRLGLEVVLMGRVTPGLAPWVELAMGQGIMSRMQAVHGPDANNAMLEQSRIMRITRGPRYAPNKEDADVLTELRPRAIVLGGGIDEDYASMLCEYASAMGILLFLNPNPGLDLRVADVGCKFVLQVSFVEFENGDASPAHLARRLLAQCAATVVIVTNAEAGAWAVDRKAPGVVLHAPAIPIADPVRHIGAGDAFFGGVVPTYLDAPATIRLERSLHVGTLTAGMHVTGLAPGDWTDLARFAA